MHVTLIFFLLAKSAGTAASLTLQFWELGTSSSELSEPTGLLSDTFNLNFQTKITFTAISHTLVGFEDPQLLLFQM